MCDLNKFDEDLAIINTLSILKFLKQYVNAGVAYTGLVMVKSMRCLVFTSFGKAAQKRGLFLANT